MVIYDLQCAAGHRFEGWFPDPKSFEAQKKSGLIHCSVCGIDAVEKIPAGGHSSLSPARSPTPSKAQKKEITTNVDAVTMLKMVDRYVWTHFRDVGNHFAKTAIDMHEGLVKEEPIYGQATVEEKEDMETKGIAFSSLPKLPDSTEN